MTTEEPQILPPNPPAPPVKRIPPINSNNARELQRLAAESRRKNKLAKEQAEEAERNKPIVKLPNANDLQIARIEKHIARLDDMMEGDKVKTPAEWRDLTQARARLFADWQTLTGLERPGVRRASKRIGSLVSASPLDPTPQVVGVRAIFGGVNIAI